MRNEITLILKEIAQLLELKGENQFKTRAYSNAAALISDGNIDIERHVKDGTLREISGIGPVLQEKLTQFVETGRMDYYEKLKAEIPQELIDISKIKGVGAKKAKVLVEKYGVSSVDELEEMAKSGKLEEIKGFGAKSALQVIESIEENKQYEDKFRLDKA